MRAHVEKLEPRRLLSSAIAPGGVAESPGPPGAVVVPLRHHPAAAFPPLGDYGGTLALSGGRSDPATLTITAEHRHGRLAGTLVVHGRSTLTFNVSGAPNADGTYTFQLSGGGSGSISQVTFTTSGRGTRTTLSGAFDATAGGSHGVGTLSVTHRGA